MKKQFLSLYRADAQDMSDVLLRTGLVAATGGILWLLSGAIHFLAWGSIFVGLTALYVWQLRWMRGEVTRARLLCALALNVLLVLWIGHVPIYVAFMHPGLLGFLGNCLVVGIALHCVARHSEFSLSAWIDAATVVFSGTGVTLGAAYHAPSLWSSLAFVFGGAAVMLYFTISLRQIIRDRHRLAQRLEEDMQSQKMTSLGQLTTGIAHDFNNLLTVIGGNIELAQGEASARDREEYLAEALAASKRGAELIRHLLAYSRKSTLQTGRHDLARVMADMERGLMRFLPEHVSFRLGDMPAGVSVDVDRAMLESAILNLVINARDAMGKIGGDIRLSVRVAKNEAWVQVEDTGPGMSMDLIRRAADPFFTTKGTGEGAGLGLSMVQGFAEQSGGRLTLSNREAGGLRATIALPMPQGAETIAHTPALA